MISFVLSNLKHKKFVRASRVQFKRARSSAARKQPHNADAAAAAAYNENIHHINIVIITITGAPDSADCRHPPKWPHESHTERLTAA